MPPSSLQQLTKYVLLSQRRICCADLRRRCSLFTLSSQHEEKMSLKGRWSFEALTRARRLSMYKAARMKTLDTETRNRITI